jgi:nucleotide-binding universal stress UspA family protein
MHILITSDCAETIERAVDYAMFFAGDASITLLHAYQNQDDRKEMINLLDHLAEKIPLETNCPLKVSLQPGKSEEVVLDEIQSRDYDLVIFGIHLHPSWHNLRPKHVARDIAKRISVPLLVVFPQWDSLQRILVWTEGKDPDELALHLTGRLASEVEVECTVLHVMSQVPLRADADMEDLERDADALMEHKSKEGEYFEEALEILEGAGVPKKRCEVLVRHGLTVNEIIKESNSGDFDLIVIGALRVSAGKSWHELRERVQEDIADRVLTEARRPVLIARKPDQALDWKDM